MWRLQNVAGKENLNHRRCVRHWCGKCATAGQSRQKSWLATAEEMAQLLPTRSDTTALLPLKVDVTSGDEVRALFAFAMETLGGLDVVINNAGIDHQPFANGWAGDEDFDRNIAVNLKGVRYCMRAAVVLWHPMAVVMWLMWRLSPVCVQRLCYPLIARQTWGDGSDQMPPPMSTLA